MNRLMCRRFATAASIVLGLSSTLSSIARADPDDRAAKPAPVADAPWSSRKPERPERPGTAAASDYEPAEAPVDVLFRAAVALALAEPERARSFVSRARLAGWLPEMRFRVYRRYARTEGLSFNDTGAGVVAPVDISAIDDVRYEWRATWDLSRIVFNPDELQAHSEALRMSDLRRDIQSLVIRLFFERRRLVAESQTSGGAATSSDAAGTARRSIRVAEIEAELEMLSGGAFWSRSPPRREAPPTP
jgi:hypothetical protein